MKPQSKCSLPEENRFDESLTPKAFGVTLSLLRVEANFSDKFSDLFRTHFCAPADFVNYVSFNLRHERFELKNLPKSVKSLFLCDPPIAM